MAAEDPLRDLGFCQECVQEVVRWYCRQRSCASAVSGLSQHDATSSGLLHAGFCKGAPITPQQRDSLQGDLQGRMLEASAPAATAAAAQATAAAAQTGSTGEAAPEQAQPAKAEADGAAPASSEQAQEQPQVRSVSAKSACHVKRKSNACMSVHGAWLQQLHSDCTRTGRFRAATACKQALTLTS